MAPKYKIIADTIKSQILNRQYETNRALPTEKALCQKYQVSRQTIRQALSLLEDEGLIKRRQGSGSHVRDLAKPAPMPHRSVAVITTYISDYIFPGILREAEEVLSRNNCTPLLFATQNRISNERRVLNSLLSLSSLDGALVEGTKTALPNPNLDLYQKLLERNIPLVFMNGNYPELSDVQSVLDDNYGGGYRLVEYLHKKGHTQIAGIFKSDDLQGHQRYKGYCTALRDMGLQYDDDHLYWYNTETKNLIYSKHHMYADQILRVLDGCTSVVCYNDEIASSLIQLLIDNGISVPRDMAVVSFDNSRYSEVGPIRITSLSHGDENVGRLAAETLVQLLNGNECSSQVALWTLAEKQSS